MSRYLLLVRRSPGADQSLAPKSLELLARSMCEWVGRGIGSGVIRGGARVGDTDQPIRMYFVIEAESPELASAIAAGCPLRELGAIDLLRLDPCAILSER